MVSYILVRGQSLLKNSQQYYNRSTTVANPYLPLPLSEVAVEDLKPTWVNSIPAEDLVYLVDSFRKTNPCEDDLNITAYIQVIRREAEDKYPETTVAFSNKIRAFVGLLEDFVHSSVNLSNHPRLKEIMSNPAISNDFTFCDFHPLCGKIIESVELLERRPSENRKLMNDAINALGSKCHYIDLSAKDQIPEQYRISHYISTHQILAIRFTDGTILYMYHIQDCCESVELDRAEETLADLREMIGEKLEHASYVRRDVTECEDGDLLWSFYTLRTLKRSVTLRFIGESNGYYSTDVEAILIIPPKAVNNEL